jgi:hypothetical protein
MAAAPGDSGISRLLAIAERAGGKPKKKQAKAKEKAAPAPAAKRARPAPPPPPSAWAAAIGASDSGPTPSGPGSAEGLAGRASAGILRMDPSEAKPPSPRPSGTASRSGPEGTSARQLNQPEAEERRVLERMGLCNPVSLQGQCAEDLLFHLRERCAEGRATRAPGIVLVGAPGCGKRTLVRWAVERLGGEGAARLSWFHPWSAASAAGLESAIVRAAITGDLRGGGAGAAKVLVLRRAELWAARRAAREDAEARREGGDSAAASSLFTLRDTWTQRHAAFPRSAVVLIAAPSALASPGIRELVHHPTAPWHVLHVDKLMLRSLTETAKQLSTCVEGKGSVVFDFAGDIRAWLRKTREAAFASPSAHPSAAASRPRFEAGSNEAAIPSLRSPASAPKPPSGLAPLAPWQLPHSHIPSIFVSAERLLLGVVAAREARELCEEDPRLFYMLWANAPLLGQKEMANAADAAQVFSDEDAHGLAASPPAAVAAFAAWRVRIDGNFFDTRMHIQFDQPPHNLPSRRFPRSLPEPVAASAASAESARPLAPLERYWSSCRPVSSRSGEPPSGLATLTPRQLLQGGSAFPPALASPFNFDPPARHSSSNPLRHSRPASSFGNLRTDPSGAATPASPPPLPPLLPGAARKGFDTYLSFYAVEQTWNPVAALEPDQTARVDELTAYARYHRLAEHVRSEAGAQLLVEPAGPSDKLIVFLDVPPARPATYLDRLLGCARVLERARRHGVGLKVWVVCRMEERGVLAMIRKLNGLAEPPSAPPPPRQLLQTKAPNKAGRKGSQPG